MKVKELSSNEEPAYRKLALKHGTLFNTIEWVGMFEGSIDKIGIYNKNNELIGGFNMFKKVQFGFPVYCNPPFTPGIGPFLKIDAKNPSVILSTWKRALSLISNFINQLPYAVVTYSFNKNVIDMQPFIWNKFKVTPRYTYIINLSTPIEDIWRRMSSERRNDITKGERDGLVIKNIKDFKIIQTLVLQTFSRQKAKVSEYYLKKILFQFSNSANSFAFATYNRHHNPIACSFFVHDKDTVYYLLGGYDHKNSHHGAGALSIWEAIKYAKTLELNCFDFEGSMIPEIEKYFRGFGGQLVPYYRINKASLPIEIFLKFFKRELF